MLLISRCINLSMSGSDVMRCMHLQCDDNGDQVQEIFKRFLVPCKIQSQSICEELEYNPIEYLRIVWNFFIRCLRTNQSGGSPPSKNYSIGTTIPQNWLFHEAELVLAPSGISQPRHCPRQFTCFQEEIQQKSTLSFISRQDFLSRRG